MEIIVRGWFKWKCSINKLWSCFHVVCIVQISYMFKCCYILAHQKSTVMEPWKVFEKICQTWIPKAFNTLCCDWSETQVSQVDCYQCMTTMYLKTNVIRVCWISVYLKVITLYSIIEDASYWFILKDLFCSIWVNEFQS